jgi:hypothetical protein
MDLRRTWRTRWLSSAFWSVRFFVSGEYEDELAAGLEVFVFGCELLLEVLDDAGLLAADADVDLDFFLEAGDHLLNVLVVLGGVVVAALVEVPGERGVLGEQVDVAHEHVDHLLDDFDDVEESDGLGDLRLELVQVLLVQFVELELVDDLGEACVLS